MKYLSKKNTEFLGSILIVMILFFNLSSFANAKTSKTSNNITVNQAYQMIKDNSNTTILDVRNQSEYDLGHLYGASLVPLYDVANCSMPRTLPRISANNGLMTDMISNAESVFELWRHTNDMIIVYCTGGSRSAQALQILVEHNFSKVYNILGGIIAWMQAGYPIDTVNHYASVSVLRNRIEFQIEPFLLHQATCSCQYSTASSLSIITSENITNTILEKNSTHEKLLQTDATNGTVLDTVDYNFLWSLSEKENDLNRTITLNSITATSASKEESVQTLSLVDQVQREEYTLTLATVIYPLESGVYNTSTTGVGYVPTNETEPLATQELINFSSPVSPSQLYRSLSQIAHKLGEGYRASADDNLHIFADRYYTISKETGLLAKIVETKIPEYNKKILHSIATIADAMACSDCAILCPIILVVIGIGCGILCVFTGAACVFCVDYLQVLQEVNGICSILCYQICHYLQPNNSIYDWPTTVTQYGIIKNGYVGNQNNLLGPKADGNWAQLYGGNAGDGGYICARLNAFEHYASAIYVYCYSAAGYTSEFIVYLSQDGYNWVQTGVPKFVSSTSHQTITCNGYSGWYQYVKIVAYDDPKTWLSSNLFVDAISIDPLMYL